MKKYQIEKKINKKEDCQFNYSFETNPTKLEFLENLPIEIDSCHYNNALCLFKSIEDILVLSYFDKYLDRILSYNIIDKKIIHIIRGFDEPVNHLSHYLDKKTKEICYCK